MRWFLCYLAQTELKCCYIDLGYFESCYIVLDQSCILALKPPKTTIRNRLLFIMCSKASPKLLKKFSNSSFIWPRDLQRLKKLHILSPILTLKLIHFYGYMNDLWLLLPMDICSIDTSLRVFNFKDDQP